MAVKDQILTVLREMTAPICDDCLTVAANLRQRQVAYSSCTALAKEQRIERERGLCTRCGKVKTVSSARDSPPERPVASDSPPEPPARLWYWEGNIQSRLVGWLRERGYTIVQEANTATREAGKDIIATDPDGKELWVSVKGFPERSTHVQARHWYAGALFDLVLYRSTRADVRLALAFPDGFTTYTTLAARTAWLRKAMPHEIYWVAQSGAVRIEQP